MHNLKVLVIDDEIGIRQGIARVLSNFKIQLPDIEGGITFSVDVAENGQEALEKFKSIKPDLMFLDYKLPDTTGLEILSQIELKEDETLAIMITAFATLETAISAIKSGAFDFLAKPFTQQELKNTISKATKSLLTARHIKKLNEERNQIRFQFISVLGHELRSPLGAVEGYLYMMRDKIAGNDITKYDDMIKRSLIRTDHMRKMINDILELTRIESGNRKREIAEVDLVEVTKYCIEQSKEDAIKNNITVHLSAEGPLTLNADKSELAIILNNFISNGIKYNLPNGNVYVTLSKTNDSIIIEVKDTGIGLSEEEQARLFNEFVRIKNNKTKNIYGSGVGLSTVKKVVGLYNGTITLSSEPDKGSTFKVIIPVQ